MFEQVEDGGAYRAPADPATADWNYGRPGNTGYRSRQRRGIKPTPADRKAIRKPRVAKDPSAQAVRQRTSTIRAAKR